MPLKAVPASSIIVLVVVVAAAIAASVSVYGYSTLVAENIGKISSTSVRSNAQVQAHDVSRIFANRVSDVMHNLQIIASTDSVKLGRVAASEKLFEAGQASTQNFTSTYFWVDRDGKLLWANAFSNPETYRTYVGADRSDRSYYQVPRDTGQPFVSAVIESVDGVPRVYYAYPVMMNSTSGEEFSGVVVAASNLDSIGQSLKRELPPSNSIGMMDNNGVILYSDAGALIGKNYMGPELQNALPPDIRDTFNSFLAKSLEGREGSGDLSYRGNTTTIAYAPVSLSDLQFAVLYITAPHRLTAETVTLLDTQRNFSTLAIAMIGATAVGVSFLVLMWNRRLSATVEKRTTELRQSNQSLEDSNRQLAAANAQLQSANEQLTLHDRLQKEFVNIAAHELRTPITPILVTMHLASLENAGNSHVSLSREQYDMVVRNAKRLEKLAADILEVTRIESQRLELHREPIDMNEKIRHVVSDAKSFVPADKKVEIVFEPIKEPIIVSADRSKLFEVLSNLVRNSIRFVDDGGKIEVKLRKSDDGSSAIVSVVDNGRGIAPEIMPRLFQKFTSSFEMGGTGLGLYISKAVVEAHGGTIWAENNRDGRGATFTFTLPVAEIPAKGADPAS
jgi:signal transduction histidine kinase